MLGQNEVASEFLNADGSLLINEIFYTLQGEGPDAGCPAVFIRLAKCNLRCYFCDTNFESGTKLSVDEIGTRVLKVRAGGKLTTLVVLTGGEPLLQNIVPLTVYLNRMGFRVSVETAGTICREDLVYLFHPHWKTSGRNQIICSPKTPLLARGMDELVAAYKYIVRVGGVSADDGLPVESTQAPGKLSRIFRPASDVPIYLQPMDEGDPAINRSNLLLATSLCMQFGYRLSVQIHKLVDLP